MKIPIEAHAVCKGGRDTFSLRSSEYNADVCRPVYWASEISGVSVTGFIHSLSPSGIVTEEPVGLRTKTAQWLSPVEPQCE